jgi:hypothetical protein
MRETEQFIFFWGNNDIYISSTKNTDLKEIPTSFVE